MQQAQAKNTEPDFLDLAIEESKGAFKHVLLFSLASNLLLLVLPIFSLQVLDRVISSGSLDTLLMLSLVAMASFIFFGLFQAVRSITLIRIGDWMDKEITPKLMAMSLSISAENPGASGSQAQRDFGTLRGFLTGAAINAILDAPWAIIYIVVIWLIHPAAGMVAIFGGIILFLFALLNEASVRKSLDEANERAVKNMSQLEAGARNAEAVEAMGMVDAIGTRWSNLNFEATALQTLASNRSAVVMSITKSVRMFLQIIVIALGGYLVLKNVLSVGGIIAVSILTARAFSPFESAIGTWGAITSARKSYRRLKETISKAPDRKGSMALPAPTGILQVEKLIYARPGSSKPILKGLSFNLAAGDSLGIVGASAAGKSTLTKLIVGVWRANTGNVRLDSADVYTWNRNDFGKHVGYLPQDVELFAGTVRDNICRMQENQTDEDVVKAAQMAECHDLILRLADGYETDIGIAGSSLSAGQRQRVALARAFYGNPKLLVLDEPNANLDEVGEAALGKALKNAKEAGITTIVVTHRPTILNHVQYIMVMQEGMIAEFGPAKGVMAKFAQRNQAAEQQRLAAEKAQKRLNPGASDMSSTQGGGA